MPVVIYMVFRPENGSVKSAGHASVLIVDSPPSHQTPSASFSYESTPPCPTVCSPREKYRGYDDLGVLPGHGEPGSGCGDFRGMKCNTCGSIFWAKYSCRERQCPSCYERWASKEARRASKRLLGGSKTLNATAYLVNRSNRKGRLPHVVVSLRDIGLSPDEYFEVAYALSKKHGVVGGCAVFHPFRQDDFDRWILDGCVHVHVIGYAPGDIEPGGTDFALDRDSPYCALTEFDEILDVRLRGRFNQWHTDDPEKIDIPDLCWATLYDMIDWMRPVFIHVPDKEYSTPELKDYGGLRSERAGKRLVRYLLTHTAIRDGQHALRWFGVLSYNKMSQNQIEEVYPGIMQEDESLTSECSVCGSRDIEPCIELDFTRRPSLIVPTIYDNLKRRPIEIPVYPDPDYPAGTPHPDAALWSLIKDVMYGTIREVRGPDGAKRNGCSLDYLVHVLDVPSERILRIIELRKQTGFVEETESGILRLRHDFVLDSALATLCALRDEAKSGRDLRLERLLERFSAADDVHTDTGFVFGSHLELCRNQLTETGDLIC